MRRLVAALVCTLAVVALVRGEEPAAKTPDADWQKELNAKLERKVSFEFVDTPFDQAVDFLRHFANVTMIIDAKAAAAGPPPITLRVTDMRTDLALDWILKLAKLQYALTDHALFIYDPATAAPPALTPADAAATQLLDKMTKRISLEFVDTPLGEALNFVASLTRTKMTAEPSALKGATVTMRASDIPLGCLARWLARQTGTHIVADGESVRFVKNADVPPAAAK